LPGELNSVFLKHTGVLPSTQSVSAVHAPPRATMGTVMSGGVLKSAMPRS